MAAWTDFPWRRAGSYIFVQLLGAFVASAVLYVAFAGPLRAFEAAQHLTRGQPGSEASAMIFGEYYPNPGGHPLTASSTGLVSMREAFFVEVVGTFVLLLVILGVSDARNSSRPNAYAPMAIGLSITLLISLFGPLTMACFNPARDFAPRLFSALAGWGTVPFTANGQGWLTVYILAPILGGQLGGAIYRAFFKIFSTGCRLPPIWRWWFSRVTAGPCHQYLPQNGNQ